jgi:serine O-acetyltransferase
MIEDDDIPLVDGQYWDIDQLAQELRYARDDWRAAHRSHSEHGDVGFPSRLRLEKIIAALCGALFPLRLGPSFVRAHNEEAFVAEALQTA